MTDFICPICSHSVSRVILDRENVPAHQHLLFDTQSQAVQMNRGHLKIVVCTNCGFIFNAAYSAEVMSYDEQYENTQSYSAVFEKQLDELIDYLVEKKGIKNCRIIEIGCGKGHFLQKLVERGGNSGIGFDPSYIGPLEKLDGRLRFIREFYDETSADIVADVVICRHVIEHIEHPLGMLETVRRALVNSPRAQVFFETPDVEWILKNQVVWDFFYEHCSYFSTSSIRLAFEKSGFLVDKIRNIFGGQYFWLEARPGPEPRVSALKNVSHFTKLAQDFEEADTKLLALWRDRLASIKLKGNIAIWGAGAKGVTFANLFDPAMESIACVVDINPNKQGKYLPGTGHPIVGPQDLPHYNVQTLILMNPNYRQEVEAQMHSAGIDDCTLLEFSARNTL